MCIHDSLLAVFVHLRSLYFPNIVSRIEVSALRGKKRQKSTRFQPAIHHGAKVVQQKSQSLLDTVESLELMCHCPCVLPHFPTLDHLIYNFI